MLGAWQRAVPSVVVAAAERSMGHARNRHVPSTTCATHVARSHHAGTLRPCTSRGRSCHINTAAATMLLLLSSCLITAVTAHADATSARPSSSGAAPADAHRQLSHYAAVLLTGAGVTLQPGSPAPASTPAHWGVALMQSHARSVASNVVGAEFLADRHAVHELLATLFQAVIPALRDTSKGRPPLSPETGGVLTMAQRLAAIVGLDQLPIRNDTVEPAAAASGGASRRHTLGDEVHGTQDAPSASKGHSARAAADAWREGGAARTIPEATVAAARSSAASHTARNLHNGIAGAALLQATAVSTVRQQPQAQARGTPAANGHPSVDTASSGTSDCGPTALCGKFVEAVGNLEQAMSQFVAAVCDAAPAAAAAVNATLQQWPDASMSRLMRLASTNNTKHNGSEFGILREVAFVRRVVVGVLHGWDLHLSPTGRTHASDGTATTSAAAMPATPSAAPPSSQQAVAGSDRDHHHGAGQPPAGTNLRARIRAAGRAMLGLVQRAEQCAARGKVGGTEVMHISKSGGSTMCALAKQAGLRNPAFNMFANCKVYPFRPLPRWMWHFPAPVPQKCQPRGEAGHWLVARIPCKDWVTYPMLNCQQRAGVMVAHGYNFQMQEVGLHGGVPGKPATAHTCPQFYNAIVLREPVERVASHIAHIERTYVDNAKIWCAKVLAGMPISTPRHKIPNVLVPHWPNIGASVAGWMDVAPAVIDNYMLRQLFGQAGVCAEPPDPQTNATGGTGTFTSAFTATDALVGAGTLAMFDHMLAMPPSSSSEADAGNDPAAAVAAAAVAPAGAAAAAAGPGEVGEVVVRLGMGWPQGLQGNVTVRRAPSPHDLESHLGFPRGSSAALAALNAWDGALVGLGARLAVLDAAVLATAAKVQTAAGTLTAAVAPGIQPQYNSTTAAEQGPNSAQAQAVNSPDMLLFGVGI